MDPNLLLQQTLTPNFMNRSYASTPQPEPTKPASSSNNNLVGPDGKLGVFWVGQDDNIWVRDNNGVIKNIGKNGTVDVSNYRQVDDWNQLNPPEPTNEYPDLSGAIALLEENIKGLDPIYQAEVKRAIEDYNTANAERLSAFNKTKQASDETAVTNDQTVLNSRNAINKNARIASEDILSILGALGMTGSTTNKALGTIADRSNENMNSSNYEYGKNKQNILQSWNDYVAQDKNQQKQLADQREYNKAQAGIKKASSMKDYLTQIAANKINMGQGIGDINSKVAEANRQIADLSGVKKTYTGVTPTYTAPAISQLLGQNMSRFDIKAANPNKPSKPKLVKVNEQTGSGDKYGLI